MTKEEFIQQVKLRIKEFLPEKYAELDVFVHEFNMEGEKMLAFAMIGKGRDHVPAADLNHFYQLLSEGSKLNNVLSRLASAYEVMDKVNEPPDILALKVDDVLKNLHVAVINFKEHPDIVARMPYLKINDLAVVPLFIAPDGDHIPLSHEMVEELGMSGDVLLAMALKNHARVLPPVLSTMSQKQTGEAEIFSLDEDVRFPMNESVYVLSNEQRTYGAAVLADKEVLHKLAQKLGDFYILPQSMHGVSIIPVSTGVDVAQLHQQALQFNKQFDNKEHLSDNIYRYRSDTRSVEMYDGKYHKEKVSSRTCREER